MSFTTAGYQLYPVMPELVLAVGAMALLMLGAFREQEGTTRLITGLSVTSQIVDGLARVVQQDAHPKHPHQLGRSVSAPSLPIAGT